MKVALVNRTHDPISLRSYRENIVQGLEAQGVEFVRIDLNERIPATVDFAWDPGLGMRRVPQNLFAAEVPVVTSVLGLRSFSLPFTRLGDTWKKRINEFRLKLDIKADWRRMREQVALAIAISQFGAEDLQTALGICPGKIKTIHLGVDPAHFNECGTKIESKPFFLHISCYRPGKNIDTLLKAYSLLPESNRPDLYLKVLGYPYGSVDLPGVRIIQSMMDVNELASLYRSALGFIFPSEYEHFGLPIIEAMACGCPVITSNVTSCPEVAGDAALLVAPGSVEQLKNAMQELMENPSRRADLIDRGRRNRKSYRWSKCVDEHYSAFETVRQKVR